MFAIELIQTYMRVKNYTLDKQAAVDLGFDRSMISKIRTGAKKLPEKSAIKIAMECNLDLAAWSSILKKWFCGAISVKTMIYSN